MGYRNKTYVCFDADTDIKYYNLMRAWKENEQIAFNFHNAHKLNDINDSESEISIKRKLEERLDNSKVMIVLVGENTKNLYKYVRWEMQYFVKNSLPVIAVNLNEKNRCNESLCPAIIRDSLTIHIPFTQDAINTALNSWPESYKNHLKNGDTGAYYYTKYDKK